MKINKIVILAVFAIFAVGAAIGGHLWRAEKLKAQIEASKIAEQKIISVEKSNRAKIANTKADCIGLLKMGRDG